MSGDASITLPFADGEYRFRLPLGQLRELQETCNAGPPEILSRLSSHRWRVDDIREPIRLGLIGGALVGDGMSPQKALLLVKRYVDDRPLLENESVATAIIMAALVGAPDDPVGKTQAGEAATGPVTDGSPSPQSTEPAAPSGTRRKK